ncbi:Amidase [Pseudohongiella spirulinae]|uniref:Amidase n=2 Tax=Pseudohongiella spirulinae TaxID=1249552 RepID=A0A0S2KCB3_9GAMM|nr:Amidase [Pseudohongiella spirulinae]
MVLVACQDSQTPATEIEMLQSNTASPALNTVPPDPTVNDLQDLMRTGRLSAEQLVQHYLDRIARLDADYNAVVEVNPDALRIARELDQERASGRERSALHGIPVLLKDNIDTADQMKTTAGSLALLHMPTPASDAFVVQRLRDAGAVILGKTNLSEWANFRSTESSSGWSARGGQTRNAYSAAHTPCGSSSGSAVAVAADLTVIAVGTETNGSIICPASNNSVVGIKPTLGLISRSGIIPIAISQDTAGPMTRTVADAALSLGAMVGADPSDAITDNDQTRSTLDYSDYLLDGSLTGKRIGVMRSLFGRNPQVDALMEAQLDILREAGATVVDIPLGGNNEMSAASYQVLLYEFKDGLNRYLQSRGGFYQSLEHIIRFNEVNERLQMPWFGQEIFLQAQAKGNLDEPAYHNALRLAKNTAQELLNEALSADNLDAIVAPSNGPGWLIDLENGDNGASVNYVSSSGLAAISGYPSITVPAGYVNGQPVGISFMGQAFSEPLLISIAHDYERLSAARESARR